MPNDELSTEAEIRRCPWAGNELSISYHDEEWGVPVHDDRTLFEFLILEGAQAGLSWSTILQKREHYRKVFDNFDATKVARYDARKVKQLLADAGIVRNRFKIAAAIQNAKSFLTVQKEFGNFDAYLWQIKSEFVAFAERRSPAHAGIGRHEQRLAQARLQICRFDDLLRHDASHRYGQRPRCGLFPLRRDSPSDRGATLTPEYRSSRRQEALVLPSARIAVILMLF